MTGNTTNRSLLCALLLLGAALPACSRQPCEPCPDCAPSVGANPATPPPPVAEEIVVVDPVVEEAAAAPEPDAAAPARRARRATPPPLSGGRVRSAREYFATLNDRFVPEAARGMRAVFQFDLSGPDAVSCHVVVDDGAMKLKKGHAGNADVTIRASTDDYVKVVNGELGGVSAVLSRRMMVGGNLILARKMKKILPGGHADK